MGLVNCNVPASAALGTGGIIMGKLETSVVGR